MGIREDIIIVGSNGLGKEIAIFFLNSEVIKMYNFLGFVDDFKNKGTSINNKKVLGDIAWLIKEKPCKNIILGFSQLQERYQLINRLTSHDFIFPTIIHPNAIIIDPTNIKIGDGSIIFPYSILTTNISIGNNVIVHIAAKIHHDTTIQNNCIVMPNVSITGGATIGNNVFLGTGAIFPIPITISDNTVVQAGSVVLA
jgi:sugar O-acyltransferase (sialic acid O-acetyltransferase NeuD family)